MNRAFFIILVPALLVAIGYVVVFRSMGVSPAYWRLILPLALLGGALWWLGQRAARKAGSGAR
jgi:ABC-type glycerol-3-phosphate transport system permease component